jgi:heat-inducible transcriptional repressor
MNEDRSDKIFDIIVRAYIETAEPIGSRVISEQSDLGLSPASIRTVMADLEEKGLLTQPHTSAGRVPTDKGYRYWIDYLMKPEALKENEKDRIHSEFQHVRSIEGLAGKVSKVISEMTDNAALIYFKNLKKVSFLNQILEKLVEEEKLNDLLEEDSELFIDGAFRIFEQPEFQDLSKMRTLLRAFSDKEEVLQILVNDSVTDLHVHIGSENTMGQFRSVSLVVKDCFVDNTAIAGVAVIGPTRMRYQKVISVVHFVADSLTEAVKNL